MQEKILSFTEYCKKFIKDHIGNVADTLVYPCDICHKLTKEIDILADKAKLYIMEWFDVAGEIYQYQEENYGEALYNPFKNPKEWIICMINEGINGLLTQNKYMEENWDNHKVEITQKLIGEILEEIQDKEIEF